MMALAAGFGKRKVLVLGLVGVGSGAAGLLPSPGGCLALFEALSYYILLALFLLWSWKSAVCLGRMRPGLLRRHGPALGTALLLAGLAFVAAPPRFKVLADETNLIGVSLMMHLQKSAAVPIEGFFGEPPLEALPDKRPALYPFLVSALHSILGYRPQNGFVLNFIAGAGILFGVYAAVGRFLPRRFAFAGALLAAAAPCFVMYTTSGGFETLNALFVVLAFLALIRWMEPGAAAAEAELALLTLLLLAHCRYESIALLPIVGAAVLWPTPQGPRFHTPGWLACGMPVFLLPILWQRRAFAGSPLMAVNKVDHGVFEAADGVFSPGRMLEHIDDNLFVLMGLNPDYGFTPLLGLLATFGLYALVRERIVRRGEAGGVLLAAAAASAAALFLILSASRWGLFTLPMTNRFGVVFLPFLATVGVYGLYRTARALKIRSAAVLILVAAVHLMLAWPFGIRQRLLDSMALPYEYHEAAAYLRKHYPPGASTVILAEQPNLYIVQGYSALRLSNRGGLADRLSQRMPPPAVVVLQKFDRRTGAVEREDRLGGGFELTTVHEIPVTQDLGLRISECRPGPPHERAAALPAAGGSFSDAGY